MLDNLYSRILAACTRPNGDYGLVSTVKMKPAEFDFNKVMPPTYNNDDKDGGILYHIEKRVGPDSKEIEVVVLDSVQSAANRMEIASLRAYRTGDFPQPMVEYRVNVPAVGGEEEEEVEEKDRKQKTEEKLFTALEFPHRVFDAYVRDAYMEDGKTPFYKTDVGRRLFGTDLKQVAKTVLSLCPSALVLGSWGSTVDLKERAFRFSRAWRSEIIGGLRSVTQKSSSRIDPAGMRSVNVIKDPADPFNWQVAEDQTRQKRNGRSSKEVKAKEKTPGTPVSCTNINYANFPPTLEKGGVSVDWIQEYSILWFPTLMQYNTNSSEDPAVRAYLCAWALYAYTLKSLDCYFRSGCEIRPVSYDLTYRWESHKPGEFVLNVSQTAELYSMALEAVRKLGLVDPGLVLKLRAAPKTEELLRRS